MMNLYHRLINIRALFVQLESTTRRIDKEYYIKNARTILGDNVDDLDYCFEVMDGQHKLGYTLWSSDHYHVAACDVSATCSLREFCKGLFVNDKSARGLEEVAKKYDGYFWFLAPLFNREWRTGINKSQLSKSLKTPMLAKKYIQGKLPKDNAYFLTQKLDGNRCCAVYDTISQRWTFWSRTGKELKVTFDMSGLPKHMVFDGEILSWGQLISPSQENFSKLSGTLNSKYGDKSDLVYMIFDVKLDEPYAKRRKYLDSLTTLGKNVLILPILAVCTPDNVEENVAQWLDKITSKGGEGVMINMGSRPYEQKRTDALLKVKEVFTMDMKVVGLIEGTGKNVGLVGSLKCEAIENGVKYSCNVGSGLSDYQRSRWADHTHEIVGHIVEVAYFSVSKNEANRDLPEYSLRFPRFKTVRDDKTETSIY